MKVKHSGLMALFIFFKFLSFSADACHP